MEKKAEERKRKKGRKEGRRQAEEMERKKSFKKEKKRIQTHKRFKRTLFIRTKHNMQMFQVIPFIKLQNDKEQKKRFSRGHNK